MFVLAGTGFNREEIPVGVIKYLKKAHKVYFEAYTNVLNEEVVNFIKKIRKDVEFVDREFVENELEKIILKNKDKIIMLLVFGNPLFATTHFSLIDFCIKNKIKYKIIMSSSVFDQIGKTGLFLYKFGNTVSIPFHESEYPFEIIKKNLENGYHTLVLLDLNPKENRYLTVREALERILKRIKIEKIIICERLGFKDEKIYYLDVKEALKREFRPPVCLIIPGKLNKIEEEFLKVITNIS